MPIEGRSLKKAANTFREHLNQVLAKTITPAPVSMVIEAEQAQLVCESCGAGLKLIEPTP